MKTQGSPSGMIPFVVSAILFSIHVEAAPHQCSDVSSLLLPDVRITAAETVADCASLTGRIKVPHCKVSGVIGTEIRFELLLPDDWNNRFFMGGGGGYVGSVSNSAIRTVNQGYATVGTDTGHQSDGLLAGWALDHPERQVNFGHLAIHRTAEVAKAVIRAYYGAGPEYSYSKGCSRGGGQALMEAQRYPDDFDGIISGAPAFDWTGFMTEMIHNVQLNFPDPGNLANPVITPENLKLLESRILNTCDRIDGVPDGIMEDPRDCPFDLADIPYCSEEIPAQDCFTRAQRAAIERVYAAPRNQDGNIYTGQPFGGESHPNGWPLWMAGIDERRLEDQGIPNLQWGFGTEFYKHFVFADPEWDYTQYDFSTWEEDTRFVSKMLNATNPDLSAFESRGGKLILWHGWSDAALSALASIKYFERVEAMDPEVRDYFRFFLLPGVMHCAGGPGPDRADWDSAIVDWVEKGIAPEQVVASKRKDGQVVMTRPLCVYPERAAYTGSGSTDEAENFVCRK